MTLPATDRYGISPAPGALGPVQDLLNTLAAGRTTPGVDLLESVDDANAWWSALSEREGVGRPDRLARADLEPLRRFRASVAAFLVGAADTADPLPTASAQLNAVDGRMMARPEGVGWQRVAALTMIRLHEAQLTGALDRLKICPGQWCNVAFYDRSKNRSAVWHDVTRCGNIANVRASRARKDAASA